MAILNSEDYIKLLIIQYKNKPKARATIDLVASQLFSDDVYFQVNDAFNLDTAIGKQLDTLGKYIKLDRFLNDGTKLNDEDFRILIKFRIIQNNSSHSHFSIDESIKLFFENTVIASSNNKMDIVYYIPEILEDVILASIQKKVLPRPMAVNLTVIKKKDNKMFGMSSYNTTTESILHTGFSDYLDYETKEGETLNYDKIL